jgi:hypothetical protein
MDKSYAEALNGINSATGQCGDTHAIKLDPAGRLTLCLASETVPVAYAWKTIDAPLENLGLYRAVMSNGCFGKVTEEKVGEEGVRVVVTTALDPTGIFYLNDSGLSHLACGYPAGSPIPSSLEAALEMENPLAGGCTVTPDPVGGATDAPCWWEAAITPDRTASGYTPGQGVTREDMLSAAVFIAAGADKTSPITLDEVVNVNNYLGVNLWTYTRVKKQQVLTIKYFPFSSNGIPGGWFKYTRGTDACVDPTTADLLSVTASGNLETGPVNVFGSSPPGVDLTTIGIPVCRDGLVLNANGNGRIVCDASSDPAYGASGVGINGCGGANWFAQAAEDARKTIWYLHNWEVPEIAY